MSFSKSTWVTARDLYSSVSQSVANRSHITTFCHYLYDSALDRFHEARVVCYICIIWLYWMHTCTILKKPLKALDLALRITRSLICSRQEPFIQPALCETRSLAFSPSVIDLQPLLPKHFLHFPSPCKSHQKRFLYKGSAGKTLSLLPELFIEMDL